MQAIPTAKLLDMLSDLHPATSIRVCYEAGPLAFLASISDTRLLARNNAIVGQVRKGRFACVRLAISIRAAFRILKACKPADTKGITKPRRSRGSLEWAPHYDKAKLGRCGRLQQVAYQPVVSTMEAVPGMGLVAFRRGVVGE